MCGQTRANDGLASPSIVQRTCRRRKTVRTMLVGWHARRADARTGWGGAGAVHATHFAFHASVLEARKWSVYKHPIECETSSTGPAAANISSMRAVTAAR